MTWIKCSDKLPEPNTDVLVFEKYLSLTNFKIASHWGIEGTCWNDDRGYACVGVTHWMPLPEAPNETI